MYIQSLERCLGINYEHDDLKDNEGSVERESTKLDQEENLKSYNEDQSVTSLAVSLRRTNSKKINLFKYFWVCVSVRQ